LSGANNCSTRRRLWSAIRYLLKEASPRPFALHLGVDPERERPAAPACLSGAQAPRPTTFRAHRASPVLSAPRRGHARRVSSDREPPVRRQRSAIRASSVVLGGGVFLDGALDNAPESSPVRTSQPLAAPATTFISTPSRIPRSGSLLPVEARLEGTTERRRNWSRTS
jgi:hypothetical protein